MAHIYLSLVNNLFISYAEHWRPFGASHRKYVQFCVCWTSEVFSEIGVYSSPSKRNAHRWSIRVCNTISTGKVEPAKGGWAGRDTQLASKGVCWYPCIPCLLDHKLYRLPPACKMAHVIPMPKVNHIVDITKHLRLISLT